MPGRTDGGASPPKLAIACDERLDDGLRVEDAAVEEQRVGRAPGHLAGVAREELPHVPRDRRIALVGEPERDDAAARLVGQRGSLHVGEEARRARRARPRRASASSTRAPPTSLEPRPSTVTRASSACSAPRMRSFASRHESTSCASSAGSRRPSAFLREAPLGDVREREVHVVAAEQEVPADRDAAHREPRRGARLRDAHQREIGRAAADVAHEDGALARVALGRRARGSRARRASPRRTRPAAPRGARGGARPARRHAA